MNNRTYYSREAEVRAERKTAFLTALALGLGAGIALLFAPNSGKKTRKDLTQGLEQGINKGQKKAEPVLKRVEDELSGLTQKVEDTIKDIRK